jgi:hypothetical protein
MKKLSFLLPIIIVACGSQVVEFPEGTPQFPVDDGGNNEPCDCPPAPVELCSNGVDDDGDGLLDCEDPDCENDEACVSGVNQNDSGTLEEDAGTLEEDAGTSQQDSGTSQHDAGTSQHDAGTSQQDSGASQQDSGTSQQDSGTSQHDSGTSQHDSGTSQQDSGTSQHDAGTSQQDSGTSQQDSGNHTEQCTNGVDDDGDQLVDCEDPDCSELDVCQPTVDSGDVCSPNHEKTCEEELHCCMKSCKPFNNGCKRDHHKYVSCVRNCANKHKVCVKKRSCGKNHH